MTTNIVSVSGGKDSVALWLWAKRTGLNPVAVYLDTGWEWNGHAAHLDMLEARIGPIHRVAGETFGEAVVRKKSFPSRMRKWCTEELKLKPFRRWLDAFRDEAGDDVQVLLGIRADESAARSKSVEREFSDFYDCDVWRPILHWTVDDVIAEHRRAAIPMHPLYHYGAERVGCFPCVHAPKSELAMVARIEPSRIDEIRALESRMGATMFTRDRRAERRRQGDDGPSIVPIGIDEVVAWAQTDRGGTQLQLIRPQTGCARWGVCEAPPSESDS